jgi:hypothetical protein
MKAKILTAVAGVALAMSVHAANWVFSPLLNGYNLLVSTNSSTYSPIYPAGTYASIGGVSNLFTTYTGLTEYSLTNNVVNGTLNTNTIAPDAFKIVNLSPDANGDIICTNASLWWYFGNTNWIPQVLTNSAGQWIITNTWPLIKNASPQYQSVATTNYYPLFPNAGTNTVTITLISEPATRLDGGGTGPAMNLFDTNNVFSMTLTFTSANQPITGHTNLPLGFLLGARHVAAAVWLPANMSTNGPNSGLLLNQLGIAQPVP